MNRAAALLILLAASCAAPPPGVAPELSIAWEKNILTISGPQIPGGPVRTLYLEAFCRSGSSDRKWGETVIPHTTEKRSGDGREIRLRSSVQGAVEVDHLITARPGEVDFRVEAVNRGPEYVDAVWVQPCIRVEGFTGAGKETYIPQCFIFVDGKRRFLDELPWAKEAIYTPGQVYIPAGIDRKDANPRPHSTVVPAPGLMGCVSADRSMLFATAWEPYQELFQGVFTCIHSDFRLGGLKPGETRRARGKIYIMENDADRLLARYRADFPAAEK